MDNDKENSRLIVNSGDTNTTTTTKRDETDSVLFKTLDGRVIKSVQPPGKGKPVVPFKVSDVGLGLSCLVFVVLMD